MATIEEAIRFMQEIEEKTRLLKKELKALRKEAIYESYPNIRRIDIADLIPDIKKYSRKSKRK